MLEVEEALSQAGLSAQMLLQIHDELLLELPEKELDATAKVVRQVMEEAVNLKIPLVIDLSAGPNWGEMSPWRK
jgi:DNA polymerase-1